MNTCFMQRTIARPVRVKHVVWAYMKYEYTHYMYIAHQSVKFTVELYTIAFCDN